MNQLRNTCDAVSAAPAAQTSLRSDISALRSENTTRTLILFTVDTVDFLFQPPLGPRAVSAIDTVTNGPAVQTKSTAEAHRARESGSSAEVCVVPSAADIQTGSRQKKTTGKKLSNPRSSTNKRLTGFSNRSDLCLRVCTVCNTWNTISELGVYFRSSRKNGSNTNTTETGNYSGRGVSDPSCTNYSCRMFYFRNPFTSGSSSHFSHRSAADRSSYDKIFLLKLNVFSSLF